MCSRGVEGTKWVQARSIWVNGDQQGSRGTNGGLWGQVGLGKVKWGVVGNIGRCLMCAWIKAKGWVKGWERG